MRLTSNAVRSRIIFPFTFGLLISILALVHLPVRIQAGAFDRNAAPQFIFLLVIGITACAYLAKKKTVIIDKKIGLILAAVVVSTTSSLILSDSFVTGFIGDTGRYAGFASFLALLIIAFLAAQFNRESFRDVLLGLSVGIVVVTALGLLQAFHAIDLPTGGGVGSTLGNLDFLAAWIGTTLLIVVLTFRELRISTYISLIYCGISLLVLWKIDAKQGYLDIGLTIFFVTIFSVLSKIERFRFSAAALKTLSTFFFFLWTEAIFLIPMTKFPLPGVSDDPQVHIRSDFWFSAAQMFIHHLGFGVGPDNYGNYYEKFRSLNSVKTTEFVLANDAHSSMMQTFGTLGIFATLSFLLLILFVIYSAIDMFKATGDRKYLLMLLAFFIFYTNSLVSPITLPNKAIFWVVAGYLIGQKMQSKAPDSSSFFSFRPLIPAVATSLILFYALSIFTPSFIKINQALAVNNAGGAVHYKASNSLPCIVYTNAQLNLVLKSGGDVPAAATSILRNHPRCLDALSFLAQDALSAKDYGRAKPYIYQLLDVAPARQSVVRLAAIYAMGAGDESLKNILTSQGLKLGILTESQLK